MATTTRTVLDKVYTTTGEAWAGAKIKHELLTEFAIGDDGIVPQKEWIVEADDAGVVTSDLVVPPSGTFRYKTTWPDRRSFYYYLGAGGPVYIRELLSAANVAGNEAQADLTTLLADYARADALNNHIDAEADAHVATAISSGASTVQDRLDGLQDTIDNFDAGAGDVSELTTSSGTAGDMVRVATGGGTEYRSPVEVRGDIGAEQAGAAAAAQAAAGTTAANALNTHKASSDHDARYVKLDDGRLTDSRTPTTHASSHSAGGSDAITPADIDAASTDDLADLENSTISALLTHKVSGDHDSRYDARYDGIGAAGAVADSLTTHEALTTAAHGGIVASTDARLTDARTPTVHASTHATGQPDAITPSSIGAEPAIAAGTSGQVWNGLKQFVTGVWLNVAQSFTQPQSFLAGVITGIIKPVSDSTAAIRIQNASGGTDILTIDTVTPSINVNAANGANDSTLVLSGAYPRVRVLGVGSSILEFARYQNTAYGPLIQMLAGRGSVDSPLDANDGDSLGKYAFAARYNNGVELPIVELEAVKGNLRRGYFRISVANGSTPVEQFRITEDGMVLLPGAYAQTTDPLIAGAVWNDGGTLKFSDG